MRCVKKVLQVSDLNKKEKMEEYQETIKAKGRSTSTERKTGQI